jgi:hypothetical protein
VSKVQTILLIIQTALSALSAIPGVGTDAAIVAALVKIFQNATALYQAETGQPFDATKIPIETKVP